MGMEIYEDDFKLNKSDTDLFLGLEKSISDLNNASDLYEQELIKKETRKKFKNIISCFFFYTKEILIIICLIKYLLY